MKRRQLPPVTFGIAPIEIHRQLFFNAIKTSNVAIYLYECVTVWHIVDMFEPADKKVFLAYGAHPGLRAETIRDVAKRLKTLHVSAQTWEELTNQGRTVNTSICAAIDKCDTLIAEVSDLNYNVLFETGYALARNKSLLLALDETDEEAVRRWNEMGILSSIVRVDYHGTVDKLVNSVQSQEATTNTETLLESLLIGGQSREQNAVFAPSMSMKFQAAVALEKYLERQSNIQILGAGEDLLFAPLDFYVKQIYRSSAAIFHLLAPKRVRSSAHNARASFMAGIAYGFDLPVLMVVEEGFVSPIDYQKLLFTYSTSAILQEHVRHWLDTLPRTSGTNKRLGRLALDIELPLSSFGQYVAEYEADELTDYFIETNEFRAILEGTAKVFVGRKGTGKTATMSQAAIELKKDRRNLVVSIKPSAYELAGLLEVVKAVGSDSHSEYMLLSLWTYLLVTEIAVRTVINENEKPSRIGDRTAYQDLATELDSLDINIDDDIAIRLEDAVSSLARRELQNGETEKDFIARQLRLQRLNRLKNLILKTLGDFERVAVLIDNLDKAWERGSDYGIMSRFILSLLSTVGKIEKDFSKPHGGAPGVNVTLTVFLRTDIYDIVTKYAREPDKIGVMAVQWQDAELLVRVLEERYGAKRSNKHLALSPDMWQEVFCPEVRGLPTRDYFLWRTLPRPRDLIFLANAALTTAINRKHHIISEADIIFSEAQYSRFAIEALLVEGEAEGFDLEAILYQFVGLDSVITTEELKKLLSVFERSEELRMWLIKSSFLGIEIHSGEFVHVEGEIAAQRKLKVAERYSQMQANPVRFRVHPAFRAYLEISDDDIHRPEIQDATLRQS